MEDYAARIAGVQNGPVEAAPTAHLLPYERVLSDEACQKVRQAEKRLSRVRDLVHFWVRDARRFPHGQESAVYAKLMLYCVENAANQPCGQGHISRSRLTLRRQSQKYGMIEEKYSELSQYDPSQHGGLHLLYQDRVLDDQQQFSEYLESSNRPTGNKWAKPFVGIIWVVPFRVMRKHAVQWGS
ncbi:TPA: hypothetical protein N0F65_012832 [Lagenidium giganteum]|uniref:Uncharacterized protein n=1 Tax=Lagenidium giganteum TaxID=4803 RepID=A0AAV2YB02_9STRA|nr:TPA: hypothetical protein N0F65_012832 [Lagenidium giganteum]